MRNAGAGPGDEAMDLRELGFVLSRGRRWIVGGALLGLLAGAAVLWLVAPRYEGRATILLRSQSAVGGGASALSELSDLLGNLPINLGGSVLETESTILTSRAVLGEVVDSLGLRVEVVEPKAVAPMALFSAVRLAPEIRDGEYRFELQGDSYRVTGPGVNGTARRGGALSLRGGELTLATGELPESFTVRLHNRESAIEALEDDLRASVLGGEVVRILYRSTSPELSAAVPNLVIARYLERRRTTDRGVNQHRYEFLRDHVASMAVQLAEAESALRRHQESSRVFDPVLTAESGVRRVSELRGQMEAAQVEARALQGILSGAGSGNLSARELAAYPTFIVNPAINGLLSRLLDLETQRVALLERRPPNDPEIVPLSQSIAHL
jgi:uncharacterized protein involved in exopolysaccharide biosynthesis